MVFELHYLAALSGFVLAHILQASTLNLLD
ncbi:uncharacterized protein METZ01_LOCUS357662 [marine metagenome]|uniref:Uncharacterized protein n=1 Tax=marine metagenome TaxID=408172 RepID=A0A382S6N3_9ZZZZ